MKATIKVRMNRTTQGAPTSTTVKTYKDGEAYDVPEDLAESFFSDGAADPAEAHEDLDDDAGGQTDLEDAIAAASQKAQDSDASAPAGETPAAPAKAATGRRNGRAKASKVAA